MLCRIVARMWRTHSCVPRRDSSRRPTVVSQSTLSVTSTSEGVQVVFGSYVDFSLDDRWCRQDLAVELVSGQDFQFLTAIQHNHHALLGRNVYLVVGGDG